MSAHVQLDAKSRLKPCQRGLRGGRGVPHDSALMCARIFRATHLRTCGTWIRDASGVTKFLAAKMRPLRIFIHPGIDNLRGPPSVVDSAADCFLVIVKGDIEFFGRCAHVLLLKDISRLFFGVCGTCVGWQLILSEL